MKAGVMQFSHGEMGMLKGKNTILLTPHDQCGRSYPVKVCHDGSQNVFPPTTNINDGTHPDLTKISAPLAVRKIHNMFQ